jgi:hypothetical protein
LSINKLTAINERADALEVSSVRGRVERGHSIPYVITTEKVRQRSMCTKVSIRDVLRSTRVTWVASPRDGGMHHHPQESPSRDKVDSLKPYGKVVSILDNRFSVPWSKDWRFVKV